MPAGGSSGHGKCQKYDEEHIAEQNAACRSAGTGRLVKIIGANSHLLPSTEDLSTDFRASALTSCETKHTTLGQHTPGGNHRLLACCCEVPLLTADPKASTHNKTSLLRAFCAIYVHAAAPIIGQGGAYLNQQVCAVRAWIRGRLNFDKQTKSFTHSTHSPWLLLATFSREPSNDRGLSLQTG